MPVKTPNMPVKTPKIIWLEPGVYIREVDVTWYAPAGLQNPITWCPSTLSNQARCALDEVNTRRVKIILDEVR